MTTDETYLRDAVLAVVKHIEEGPHPNELNEPDEYDDPIQYYDIRWILNGDKEMIGAQLMVAGGGPNIWIDTVSKTVKGYWWNESYFHGYDHDALDLDQYLEMIYDC